MIVPIRIGSAVHCEICGAVMLQSEVDVLCVACSAEVASALLPDQAGANFWDEPEEEATAYNNEYDDSEFDCSAVELAEEIAAGTGGSSEKCFHEATQKRQCTMYDKLGKIFPLEREVIPIEDDTFAIHCHCRALSRCWLEASCGFVKFGLPELRNLSRRRRAFSPTQFSRRPGHCARHFVWDAPFGFVAINLARRKCFHINVHDQHVEPSQNGRGPGHVSSPLARGLRRICRVAVAPGVV